MSQFMLLLHESPTGFTDLSPERMQEVIGDYQAWAGRMSEEGRLGPHQKLKDEGGRWLTGFGSELKVVDGPFAEAKEVIGGYFIIDADGYDDAVELTREHPHLKYGGRVELREVDPV